MSIDWTMVITSLIAMVTGGGIMKLLTLKQEKRSKDIDNAERIIERYEKMNDQIRADAEEDKRKYKEETNEAKKQVKELTAKVNDLYARIGKLQKDLEMMQISYSNAAALKCENLNCKKRFPPLKECETKGKENGKEPKLG